MNCHLISVSCCIHLLEKKKEGQLRNLQSLKTRPDDEKLSLLKESRLGGRSGDWDADRRCADEEDRLEAVERGGGEEACRAGTE